eukprot:11091933-Karenia_brevis.AAC.1
MLSGIFCGYSGQAGGGWNGDILIADWDQLEDVEMASEIHLNRSSATEMHPVKFGDWRQIEVSH